jgi:hypothetical protein
MELAAADIQFNGWIEVAKVSFVSSQFAATPIGQVSKNEPEAQKDVYGEDDQD